MRNHIEGFNMRVSYDKMYQVFCALLEDCGMSEDKARRTAAIFADNSRDGIYSHGLNRFPRFISYLKSGMVKMNEEPELELSFGALERWNGRLGIGCLNAEAAVNRASELALQHGIGCVAMRNTNHWMRGGSYGLIAAKKGLAAICWSNTFPNIPAWGTKTPKLGNNPLVMAFPSAYGTILMDGAMSQYSWGAVDKYRMEKKELPFPGGYDKEGELTTDPAAILESGRFLPIGFWKGSGYSLLLDLIGAALSSGNTVSEIGASGTETALTQIFIVFDIKRTCGEKGIQELTERVLADFRSAEPAEAAHGFTFPGERLMRTRKENLEQGIPVNEEIWRELTDSLTRP